MRERRISTSKHQNVLKNALCAALLVALPSMLCASEAVSIQESDFIQRTINFVIFAAILWYFAADSLKGIFINRKNAIASRLQEAQEKLHKAKRERENAQKKLEESKERAKQIVDTAKKEAYHIEERYNEQIKKDIESLKYALTSSCEFERKKITQESVNELLDELLKSDELQLNREDYVNIITKRIS